MLLGSASGLSWSPETKRTGRSPSRAARTWEVLRSFGAVGGFRPTKEEPKETLRINITWKVKAFVWENSTIAQEKGLFKCNKIVSILFKEAFKGVSVKMWLSGVAFMRFVNLCAYDTETLLSDVKLFCRIVVGFVTFCGCGSKRRVLVTFQLHVGLLDPFSWQSIAYIWSAPGLCGLFIVFNQRAFATWPRAWQHRAEQQAAGVGG